MRSRRAAPEAWEALSTPCCAPCSSSSRRGAVADYEAPGPASPRPGGWRASGPTSAQETSRGGLPLIPETIVRSRARLRRPSRARPPRQGWCGDRAYRLGEVATSRHPLPINETYPSTWFESRSFEFVHATSAGGGRIARSVSHRELRRRAPPAMRHDADVTWSARCATSRRSRSRHRAEMGRSASAPCTQRRRNTIARRRRLPAEEQARWHDALVSLAAVVSQLLLKTSTAPAGGGARVLS